MFDFLGVKKAVNDLASQVKSIKAHTEKLKRKREDIANAPAAKSDIKAHLNLAVVADGDLQTHGFKRQADKAGNAPFHQRAHGAVANIQMALHALQ
jgi:hypothetical protein